MKKIGIVTIVSYNYGNRLQNYALQKFLKDNFSCEVYTLRNITGVESRFTLQGKAKRVAKGFIGKTGIAKYRDAYRRLRFDLFNKRNITMYDRYLTSSGKIDEVTDLDYVIAGSDQIWSPGYVSEIEMLKFVESKKRISYAASLGVSTFDEKFDSYIVENLNGFVRGGYFSTGARRLCPLEADRSRECQSSY